MKQRNRVVSVLLLLLGLCSVLHGQDSKGKRGLHSELRVEKALLRLDLEEHGQLRKREKAYRNQIRELEKKVDEMIAAEPFLIEEIVILDDTLTAARRAAHGIAERADEVRQRVYGHWRRIALLDLESENQQAPVERSRDPISGQWRVQVLPAGQSGTFRLQLEGTLVRGTYELAGGSWGSLRGTFVGSTLRLERIDAKHGFDLVLEGTISDDRARVDGTWVATLLTTGGPGNGHWSLQRQTPSQEESQ